MSRRFYKAKIIACSNSDFWYAKCVGQRIRVRESNPEQPTSYVECSTGDSVLRWDLEPVWECET